MNLISKILLVVFLSALSSQAQAQMATRGQALIYFAQLHVETLPDSYQYIRLNHLNIPADSQLEDALQVLVYLGLMPNKALDI
jgi:hypothetical protein